jgi:hypothetical protein
MLLIIYLVHSHQAACFGNLLFPSFAFQEHKGIPLMMLKDGLLGALGLGGGG